jgi:hypothetical protein
MSNRVYIQICEFTDYVGTDVDTDHTYGYRIWDDYDQWYNNTFDTLDAVFEFVTEERVFELVWHNHFELWETVDERGGLYLNNDWVELSSQLHNYTLEHDRLDSSDWNCQD